MSDEIKRLKAEIERKDVLIRDLRLRLKEFELERMNRGRIKYGYK